MPENNANNYTYQPQPQVNETRGNDNGCGCGCGCNGGFLNGLFGGCSGDTEILFFIIIFLLLFTNFGCCGCCRG